MVSVQFLTKVVVSCRLKYRYYFSFRIYFLLSIFDVCPKKASYLLPADNYNILNNGVINKKYMRRFVYVGFQFQNIALKDYSVSCPVMHKQIIYGLEKRKHNGWIHEYS